MEWYLQPFKKYADFSGRARRKEYWTFVLINGVISGVINVLGSSSDGLSFLTILGGVFGLAILIPSLAVAFRRMHDIGKSGGWYFIALVPLVGWIVYLVFTVKDSEPGDNKYGPNPKGDGGATLE